ncbi:hypothetical protein C8R44DRAFT_894311 [Mycena epipterygia]|nr:hypothetical protein C8R44DRAFT_894311 [Mycena epipterygia]
MPVAYQRLPIEAGDEKYLEPRRPRFSRTVVVLLFIVGIETTAMHSPVQHGVGVEEMIKVYPVAFDPQKSPFQVPSSPAFDAAWEDLYLFGMSRITKSEAALLPNKMIPIPGDPGYCIAQYSLRSAGF